MFFFIHTQERCDAVNKYKNSDVLVTTDLVRYRMMAGGRDTLKRYLTSVMIQNYLYTLEVNYGQAVYDEWTKSKFQEDYWRRGRRQKT